MTIVPDFKSFQSLAAKGNLIPVRLELPADLETPVSAFAKLTRWGKAKRSFLLESVEGGEKVGRYSYLGVDPDIVLETRARKGQEWVGGKKRSFEVAKDPLEELKTRMAAYRPVAVPGLPPFWGGAVGYLSYDCVRFFEKIP
ncbi:MAG: anthranilate synthase component I, partial [candidate division FCPU426 bacterium]